MVLGKYRGRWEENPGRLMFRYKAEIKLLKNATEYVKKLRAAGHTVKLTKYTDGYAVYVMAKHDFSGRSFHVDYRRK